MSCAVERPSPRPKSYSETALFLQKLVFRNDFVVFRNYFCGIQKLFSSSDSETFRNYYVPCILQNVWRWGGGGGGGG